MGGLGELLVDGDSVNTRIAYPAEKPLLYRKVHLIEDFNRWIEGGAEPHVPARDGMIMVAVADALVTSSRQGKAVKVGKI